MDTLESGTIMTLISPGDCTLQCSILPCGSGIMTVNSPSGSTLQCDTWLWDDMPWNSPNVRHIGILHLVSILTISPQSTCHSAPVCEILSKSDNPQHKKMTSCGSQPSTNLPGWGERSVGWQITLCDPIDKWRPVVLR